jgi:leader peptidase (prepilin peptidase)/N-methyltransferase
MTILPILIFTTGLIIGSFLNVVIYRLPENESIITPPSHCSECGTRLGPLDLVPILSFLFFRGRCRYCDNHISWQYPAVELLTGILYLLSYLKFGLSLDLIIYLGLISILIVCSFIDLKYKIIPNKITYPGIIIGLVLSLFFNHITIKSSLMGLVIPAGLLLLLAIIFKGGMGLGDVKLVGMIGVFIGYGYTLAGIFLGALVGSIVFLPLLIAGKVSRKTRIPFGPLISLGAVIMILFGSELIGWYLGLFV